MHVLYCIHLQLTNLSPLGNLATVTSALSSGGGGNGTFKKIK